MAKKIEEKEMVQPIDEIVEQELTETPVVDPIEPITEENVEQVVVEEKTLDQLSSSELKTYYRTGIMPK
jgi:hypothetical protein